MDLADAAGLRTPADPTTTSTHTPLPARAAAGIYSTVDELRVYIDSRPLPAIILDATQRPWIIAQPEDPADDYDAWSHDTSTDEGLSTLAELKPPFNVLWPVR